MTTSDRVRLCVDEGRRPRKIHRPASQRKQPRPARARGRVRFPFGLPSTKRCAASFTRRERCEAKVDCRTRHSSQRAALRVQRAQSEQARLAVDGHAQSTHPGEIIKTLCLEPLGVAVAHAAEALGVSRKTLSAILNGRAGISPEMAVRLSIAFGTSAESWLNQQVRSLACRAAPQATSGREARLGVEDADEHQLGHALA